MGALLLLSCCFLLLLRCSCLPSEVAPLDSTTTQLHSDRRGKALKLSHKPCSDPSGHRGVCTFRWECISGNGTLMGTCQDGFVFGTCCRYDPADEHEEATNEIADITHVKTSATTTTTTSTTTTRRPTSRPTTPSHLPLVTWTSVGPTRPTQRPIVLRPFPFGPQSGWPVGVAIPVVRPTFHHQRPPPNNNGTTPSYTILSGPDKSATTTVRTKTTTVSVPIPQWTTTTTERPTTLPGNNVSRPQLDYRKDCGVRTLGGPRARIVGGESARPGRWPWQVLVKEAAWLGLYQKNKCGGVLVSPRYALTAGHCQPGRFLSALVVILGEFDLLSAESTALRPEIRRVRRMIVHRAYDPRTFDNDIALLELEGAPVAYRPHIAPICLPEPREDFTGRMAYVTGWGKTSHGGAIPNLLQEVRVPVLRNSECSSMFEEAGHKKLIKDTFLCAGYKSGGKDSCEGDSGGPLMVERAETGQWVLAGTVSHGIRCADPNLPGVYVRIAAYRHWIDKIIAA